MPNSVFPVTGSVLGSQCHGQFSQPSLQCRLVPPAVDYDPVARITAQKAQRIQKLRCRTGFLGPGADRSQRAVVVQQNQPLPGPGVVPADRRLGFG